MSREPEQPTINGMSIRKLPVAIWLPLVAIVAVWAALHGFIVFAGTTLDGDLFGTDPYMRLVRVSELIEDGGWFDSVIERSNAPFGDELHWTRPFDVLLIALAAPLVPFVGFQDALFTAGVIVSPLLHLIALFGIIWAVTPLFGNQRARLAAIVAIGQPMIILQVMPGQADHHSLQLLALVVELGLLIRLFDAEHASHRPRLAVAAGVVAGFGIWVSPEMTILSGLAAAVLGIAWLRDQIPAIVLRRYALGMATLIAVALLVEHPPSALLDVEYDKISVAHLATAFAVLLVAVAFEWIEARPTPPPARLLLALPVAGVVGLILLFAFRGLVQGPVAAVDPRLIPLWLDHVSELQPLFPSSVSDVGWLLVAAGPVVITLPVTVISAWRTRHDPTGPAWAMLAILSVGYFALALWHVRFMPFAAIFIAIVSAEILGRMRDWMQQLRFAPLRRVAWAITAPLFVVGSMIVGAIVIVSTSDAEAANEAAEVCDLHAAAAAIDHQPGSPNAVVYAHIDFGPELLYRTDAAIVAGPYHRNGTGILDVYEFFSSTDLDQSRRLAEARGARFVLVCDTRNEAGFFRTEEPGAGLYERLVSDDPPEWLSLTARGTEEQRFRLYEFRSDR